MQIVFGEPGGKNPQKRLRAFNEEATAHKQSLAMADHFLQACSLDSGTSFLAIVRARPHLAMPLLLLLLAVAEVYSPLVVK